MEGGISVVKKEVCFSGIPIATIAKKYKTPTFVFSEQRLLDNYHAFTKAFKKHYANTQIYYSLKTNFEPQILRSLNRAGCDGEIASNLELEIAKSAGFFGNQLVADGPAWTGEDITGFIKAGVKTLNLDSLTAMHRVNAIAKKLNKKVNVGFRIFPELPVSLFKSFIEQYVAKFGIPVSQALEAFRQLTQMSNLIPVGISTHIGSMITDPGNYEKALAKLVKLAADIKHELGINIQEINLGGGYGLQSLNYFSIQNIVLNKVGMSVHNKAASIEEFGHRIGTHFSSLIKRHKLGNLALVLEPGRFIVSDAGILITRAVSVKDNWVFLDGGGNYVPESIFFVRRDFIVGNKVKPRSLQAYNIAGPTLSTGDVLATNQKLPHITEGDLVTVLNAGAYTLSRSNQFTMLRPDVLYITKAKALKYLRKKEQVRDLTTKLII